MNKFLLLTLLSIVSTTAYSQIERASLKKVDSKPIYFVDSVNIDPDGLDKFDSNQIAMIYVVGSNESIVIAGEDGKDGVIYIETIPFATKRYQRYFKSKSPEYAKVLSDLNSDSSIQYVLNKKILTASFAGDLASIDDKVFKEIKILNKETLKKEYGITDKEYGVLILSDVPNDLHHGKKKF